jgi:hypothetical protein
MKTFKQALGASPAGRIILHLSCMFRNGHLRWHLQGIAREFGH